METAVKVRLTPAMKAVLLQMVGGQDWTHHPWKGWVLPIFRRLAEHNLVAEAPHRGGCHGNCANHWVITALGEEVAATIPPETVRQDQLVWDGE